MPLAHEATDIYIHVFMKYLTMHTWTPGITILYTMDLKCNVFAILFEFTKIGIKNIISHNYVLSTFINIPTQWQKAIINMLLT